MKGSLKRKIAIRISIVISLLFAIVMVLVYISFSDFRRDEFENRFKQRLLFTIRFIEQSKDFNEEAPVFFNENSDNVLLNEQILIFDAQKKLIYSTVKDESIQWDDAILEALDHQQTIFKDKSTPEIYAALREIHQKKYYILTSAQDSTGVAKLAYLKYLLTFSFVLIVLGVGLLSYYLLTKYLRPLERLNERILTINAGQLLSTIEVIDTHDEIATLSQSFNTMLHRINEVFDAQKSFTASASHELRTPLARMAFQLENLCQSSDLNPTANSKLKNILSDVYQLSDLTQSLLLLSKIEELPSQELFEEVRIDEVLYDAYQKVEKSHKGLELHFMVSENITSDATLTVLGQKSLLEIVFINLFKNAALYSIKPWIGVELNENTEELKLYIDSVGETLTNDEQKNIFNAFTRGGNAQHRSGSGLGLRIVQRILKFHQATIGYEVPKENLNRFVIRFYRE
ncbi:MAG: HAMP domain-containing histidine kinase [Bacteroidetes bacterium]|nr:HAMP domain-containing histidine kinase [Bacteroidota bacterium]